MKSRVFKQISAKMDDDVIKHIYPSAHRLSAAVCY